MSSKGTVVVIGSGAAGSPCAKSLAGTGWSVILAEHDRWGGTCLWRGCIPKKSLFQSAAVARTIASAEQFGVTCSGAGIDWQAVLAWKWHSQETYAGDQKALLAQKGITLAETTAEFASADEVLLDGERVRFDHAVIATGSRAVVPPIPGAELADTSDAALRYPELPSTLVIIGGGYIAMEMAGIYASFGTRVTMLVRGEALLETFDPELADAGRRGLERLGVRFRRGCTATGISGEPGVLRLTYSGHEHDGAIDCERVLVATGRAPYLEGLGLETAGVQTDEHGRLVLDPYLRTTNPRVWAVGDVTAGMMQTPIVSAEGRHVAAEIDTGELERPDCSATPVACFTVPELATVGLDERTAEKQGRTVDVHRFSLDQLGAAIISDDRDGFAKLIVDPGGRVVGGQIAAPYASSLIYSIALAVRTGATVEQLMATPGVHPSLAESVFNAAW